MIVRKKKKKHTVCTRFTLRSVKIFAVVVRVGHEGQFLSKIRRLIIVLKNTCGAMKKGDEGKTLRNGAAVRVHRDGSTTLIHVLDPVFRAETNAACHVACSSSAFRYFDMVAGSTSGYSVRFLNADANP